MRKLVGLVLVACLMAGCSGPLTELKLGPGSDVPAGQSLVLADVAIDASGVDEWIVSPGASLVLRHSSISGGDGLVVRVKSGARLHLEDVESSRVRFMLDPGATAHIANSTLELQRGGIVVANATLEVAGSTLRDSSEEWVRVIGGNATIVGSTLLRSGHGRPGIVADHAQVRLIDSTLQESASYGIQAVETNLTLQGITVIAAGDYGLQMLGGELDSQAGRWLTHCGILLADHATGSSQEDVFEASQRAITVTNSNLIVTNATIHALEGAEYFHSSGSLRDSMIRASGVGLRLVGSNVTVASDVFEDAGVEAKDSDSVLRGNSFEGDGVSLRNHGIDLDASSNWWGTLEGPRPGQVEGPVQVSPWLSQKPIGAFPQHD